MYVPWLKMDVKMYYLFVFSVFLICFIDFSLGLKRCFSCRSRGELGSCKDPFIGNVTAPMETQKDLGFEMVPCASGWCGKIVENESDLKEEYGVATERICFQRGPSDSEERCAYTKRNNRRVLMCFCKGDLCNSSTKLSKNIPLFFISIFIYMFVV